MTRYPWTDLRLTQAAAVAAEHGCACAVDVESLVAEVRMLRFCLDQARIVLEHFKTELPDPDHRRLAEGAMIASAPPGTLPGERHPARGGDDDIALVDRLDQNWLTDDDLKTDEPLPR